ncbi:MAG: LPXTG cell wall anchor domain-containing protein [Clostridiales bacterium]
MKKLLTIVLLLTFISVSALSGTMAFAEGATEEPTLEEVTDLLSEKVEDSSSEECTEDSENKENEEAVEETEEEIVEEEVAEEVVEEEATEEETVEAEESTETEETVETEESTKTGETPKKEEATEEKASETEDLEDTKAELDKIIKAYAKIYGLSEEEAALDIELLIKYTEEMDGSYEINEDGSLVFVNSVIYELTSDGTFLVNGEDYSEFMAEVYNLSIEEGFEFLMYMLEGFEEEEGFILIESSNEKIVFMYEGEKEVIEITKEGYVYIDGEKIEPEEVKEVKKQKPTAGNKDENPLKLVANEKVTLPQTGEESSNTLIYVGTAVILLGAVSAFVMYKRKKATN